MRYKVPMRRVQERRLQKSFGDDQLTNVRHRLAVWLLGRYCQRSACPRHASSGWSPRVEIRRMQRPAELPSHRPRDGGDGLRQPRSCQGLAHEARKVILPHMLLYRSGHHVAGTYLGISVRPRVPSSNSPTA